jgi:hypothetical protein
MDRPLIAAILQPGELVDELGGERLGERDGERAGVRSIGGPAVAEVHERLLLVTGLGD